MGNRPVLLQRAALLNKAAAVSQIKVKIAVVPITFIGQLRL